MRTISLINSLFLIFSLLQGGGIPQNAAIPSSLPENRLEELESRPALDTASVSLEAATGARILFKAENGQEVNAPDEEGRRIPYLVLNRNGAPTPNSERTLDISLYNLQVASSGLYAELEIETEHGDPDLGRDSKDRIRVWGEKRFISSPADSQASQPVDFTVTFQLRAFVGHGIEDGRPLGAHREAI